MRASYGCLHPVGPLIVYFCSGNFVVASFSCKDLGALLLKGRPTLGPVAQYRDSADMAEESFYG